MERLRSLDFQLVLHIDYNFSQLKIINGEQEINLPKGAFIHDFTINSVSHKETLYFKGFDPHDKKQKIKLSLLHQGRSFDIHAISEYQAYNNEYVSDSTISNIDEIFFNGHLTLSFFETWFCCNFLQGGVLQDKKQKKLWKCMEDYLNPGDACLNHNEFLEKNKEYDIVFSGTCFTGTNHARYLDKIPYTLQGITDRKVTNISFNSLNAYATLHNAHNLVDNFKMKVLFFSPSNVIQMALQKQFLDRFYIYPFVSNQPSLSKNHFHSFKDTRKNSVKMHHKKKRLVSEIIKKSYQSLVEKCRRKNIDLVLLVFRKKNRNSFWKQFDTIHLEMTQNPKILLDVLDRHKTK